MSSIAKEIHNFANKVGKVEIQHRTSAADKQADAAVAKLQEAGKDVNFVVAGIVGEKGKGLTKVIDDLDIDMKQANADVTCPAGRPIVDSMYTQRQLIGTKYLEIDKLLGELNKQIPIVRARKETIREIRHEDKVIATHDDKTNNLIDKANKAGGEAEAAGTAVDAAFKRVKVLEIEIGQNATEIRAKIRDARAAQATANTAAASSASGSAVTPAVGSSSGNTDLKHRLENVTAAIDKKSVIDSKAGNEASMLAAKPAISEAGYETDIEGIVKYAFEQNGSIEKAKLASLAGPSNQLARNQCYVDSIITAMKDTPFLSANKDAKEALVLRVLVKVCGEDLNKNKPALTAIKKYITEQVNQAGDKLGYVAANSASAKPVLNSAAANSASSSKLSDDITTGDELEGFTPVNASGVPSAATASTATSAAAKK